MTSLINEISQQCSPLLALQSEKVQIGDHEQRVRGVVYDVGEEECISV